MSTTDTSTDFLDPLVTTDQLDYSPGSTATIFAGGFGIGDDIQFTITVIDPTTGAILWSGPSWDAVAGSDGTLLTSFFVTSAYAGATIQLTATDAVTGQVASEVFTDSFYDTASGDPPARDGTTYAAPTNIIDLTTTGDVVGPSTSSPDTNGAIWEQGSLDVSANGQFKAFLIVQQDGNEASEQGYNTGATVSPSGQHLLPLDDKHLIGNASPIVNVNDLQVISQGGHDYYGFVVSINQAHDLPNNLLSLDALQIFQASDATLTGTTSANGSGEMSLSLPGATMVYDLQANEPTEVELNANLTRGNSHGDAMVLIPVSDFSLDHTTNPYVYLYSAFGQENPTNGGFEQWAAIEHATTPSPEWVLFKDVVVGAPNGDGSPDVVNDGNDEAQPVVETNPLNNPPSDTVVDHAGQALVYTVTLDNTGNVDITDVTAADSLLGLNLPETGGSGTYYWNGSAWETGTPEAIKVVLSGDTIDGTNTDGTTLETNAIWTWTYSYSATQQDLENDGNPALSGYITNTVTTTSTTNNLLPDTASTSVAVDQDMVWPVHKSAGPIDYTNGLNHDSGESGVVDGAGDVIPYTVTLDNSGNLYMPNVAVFDSLLNLFLPENGYTDTNHTTAVSGDGTYYWDGTAWETGTVEPIKVVLSGDTTDATNTDGTTLEMGAHWIWTYSYTATQAQLDNNGNGHDYSVVPDSSSSFTDSQTPGYISNLVTATSTLPNTTLTEYSATAMPVDQDPSWAIVKTVSVAAAGSNDGGTDVNSGLTETTGDTGTAFNSNQGMPDTGTGHSDNLADSVGQVISYAVTLTNNGNLTISGVDVADSLLGTLYTDSLGQDPVAGGLPHASGMYYYLGDDGHYDPTTITFTNPGGHATLDVGETWTWDYTYTLTQADIENNGTASGLNPGSGQAGVSDEFDPVSGKFVNGDANSLFPGHQGYIVNTVTADASTATDGAMPEIHATTYAPVEFEMWWPLFKDVAVGAPQDANDAGKGTITETNSFPGGNPPFVGAPLTNTSADPVDHAGQVLTYTLHLDNEGNLLMTGVHVEDSLLGQLYATNTGGTLSNPVSLVPGDNGAALYYEGDDGNVHSTTVAFTDSGNGDTVLDPGELWTWTYTYAATQQDLNNNGNPAGGGTIANTATAISDQATEYQSATVSIDQDPAINVEKLVSVDYGTPGHATAATADWYLLSDDGNLNDVGPSGADVALVEAATGLVFGTNLFNGAPVALGPHVAYEAVISNTGNVDLSVNVSDPNVGTLTETNVAVGAGQSVVDGPVQVATIESTAANPTITNTITATGTYDTNQAVPDTDSVNYTTPIVGPYQGLTKGFWANHQYVWDGITDNSSVINNKTVYSGDDWWSGTTAPKGTQNDPYGNEGVLYPNPISSQSDLNTHQPGHLVLGDGLSGSTLNFDLLVAQSALNTSVTGDARLIVASQAIAAQLNDYNIGHEPDGLIEAAVKWLTSKYSAGTLSGGNVDGPYTQDADGNPATVVAGTDYNLKTGAFTTAALSSSSANFQAYATDALGSYQDNGHTYEGSGNGLANALTAFNQGQLVLDTTGHYLEWVGTNHWFDNTHPGAFWEVAYGHVSGITQV